LSRAEPEARLDLVLGEEQILGAANPALYLSFEFRVRNSTFGF
jgi:hypothetical protein